jgi:hypothetical protein
VIYNTQNAVFVHGVVARGNGQLILGPTCRGYASGYSPFTWAETYHLKTSTPEPHSSDRLHISYHSKFLQPATLLFPHRTKSTETCSDVIRGSCMSAWGSEVTLTGSDQQLGRARDVSSSQSSLLAASHIFPLSCNDASLFLFSGNLKDGASSILG